MSHSLLLGLGSLLRNNISLHLDNHLGHYLGNNLGGKIQLEQLGLQIYLSACPSRAWIEPLDDRTPSFHIACCQKPRNKVRKMSQDEGGAKLKLALSKT